MNQNHLIIEIVSGHDGVITRKTEFGDRFSQKGYMHTGGAFPVEIRIPLPDSRALPTGKYIVKPTAFRAGKYGDIEVNNFDLSQNLLLVQPAKSQA